MSEEQFRKLCREEFLKNIKENIKSETIFVYIDELEKENKKQKEILEETDEAVEYWQKECDKRSKVLDKIKELLKEIE